MATNNIDKTGKWTMNTKTGVMVHQDFYSLEDFEAGRKFAEVNEAIVEVLDCEQKEHGCKLTVKFYGGSLLVISTAENDVYTTWENKRRLPWWVKRGLAVYDPKNGETYVIESVGNQRVQLRHGGDSDLRNIIMHTIYLTHNQPKVADWVKVGARCKRDGLKGEIVSLDYCMAKVRVEIGNGETCVLDSIVGELRPDIDERKVGMTDKEIEQRQDDIYFRVYRGGVRIGKWDHFSKREQQELEEMSCRSMINSCLLYGRTGFYNDETGTFGRYGEDYVKRLGRDIVLQLWEAQKERFSHARTHYAGTDSEGGGYYSIEWDAA